MPTLDLQSHAAQTIEATSTLLLLIPIVVMMLPLLLLFFPLLATKPPLTWLISTYHRLANN